MTQILNTQPGFIHAMWCGNAECEAKIKEIQTKNELKDINSIKIGQKLIIPMN